MRNRQLPDHVLVHDAVAVGQLAQAEFLLDFGVVLLSATIASEIFKRLKLPGAIGAILAGVIVGPYSLDLVTNIQTVNLLALLGSVLILFVVGIEFEASAFWAAGRASFLLTTFGVVLTIIIGYQLGIWLGWTNLASFLLGVVLAPSGTSVIAGILSETGRVASKAGSTVLSAAIIDDVEGVILLTIALSLAIGSESVATQGLATVAVSAIAFVLLSILLGSRIFPRIVVAIEKYTTDEALFALLLGLGLVLAFGATQLGLAAITGAFIMGVIIPARKIGERFVHRIIFMKEIFASIFFTTVGMSLNPQLSVGLFPIIALVTLLAVGSRMGGGLLGALAGGLGLRLAVVGAVALVARAEMTLIIAKQSVDAGLAGQELLVIAAAVVIITTIASAPVFKRAVASLPPT